MNNRTFNPASSVPVRGIAIRNGIANGEQYIGVVAGATPDMYVSNNAGTINFNLRSDGNITLAARGGSTWFAALPAAYSPS